MGGPCGIDMVEVVDGVVGVGCHCVVLHQTEVAESNKR